MSAHNEASPGPAALAALSVVCFAFFAILTGRVPHEATPLLFAWCIAGGIIQIFAGAMDLKHGDIAGGTIFFVFGCFFMLAVGLSNGLLYYSEVTKVHVDPSIEGYIFLCLALILFGLTPAFLTKTSLFFLALIDADILVLILALVKLGLLDPGFSQLAGWLALALGLIGIYLLSAIVFNTAVGRSVLPVGSPLIKSHSTVPLGENVKS